MNIIEKKINEKIKGIQKKNNFYSMMNDNPRYRGISNESGMLDRYKMSNPESTADYYKGLNESAYGKYGQSLYDSAYGEGPSDYAKNMYQMQDMAYQTGKTNLDSALAGQRANSIASLGLGGKVDAGSIARMNKNMNMYAADQNARLNYQNMMAKKGIAGQDAANKQQLQQWMYGNAMNQANQSANLYGGDVRNRMAVEQWNKGQDIQNLYNRNQWNYNAWNQKLSGMGADITADAQAAAANNNGGFKIYNPTTWF